MPQTDTALAVYLISPGSGPRFTSPHTLSVGPLNGEDDSQWTDRLCRVGASLGIYRQCSIGWHEECSQRSLGSDAECRCQCHEE